MVTRSFFRTVWSRMRVRALQNIFALLAFASSPLAAQTDAHADVPNTLFGVPLGTIVELTAGNPRKLIGLDDITVVGVPVLIPIAPGRRTLYFRPANEQTEFPYVEFEFSTYDRRSNFEIVLQELPPDAYRSQEELLGAPSARRPTKYEVVGITWRSGRMGSDALHKGYEWARTTCKSWSGNLSARPELSVKQGLSGDSFQCEFKQETRRLTVFGTLGSERFSLSYSEPVLKQKSRAFEQAKERIDREGIKSY